MAAWKSTTSILRISFGLHRGSQCGGRICGTPLASFLHVVVFLPVAVAACFFRTFDDDQGLQEQWPPLAERARRESGELHLPPLDTELTGRTQEHSGRKVRNPIVLTPPARIKKKSETSSPIELIRSARSMRNVDFAHSCTGCRAHRLHPGVSRRICVSAGTAWFVEVFDGYLEPKDLDETVSELHFSSLGSELTVPTQVTQPSMSKTGEHYRY